jgi:hypothetical protein
MFIKIKDNNLNGNYIINKKKLKCYTFFISINLVEKIIFSYFEYLKKKMKREKSP